MSERPEVAEFGRDGVVVGRDGVRRYKTDVRRRRRRVMEKVPEWKGETGKMER